MTHSVCTYVLQWMEHGTALHGRLLHGPACRLCAWLLRSLVQLRPQDVRSLTQPPCLCAPKHT
jgi:hypothetical protein